MLNRHAVHQEAVANCERVLEHLGLSWRSVRRDEMRGRVSDVDLVLSIGGDGTLLEASHHLSDDIPVLGLNSDPTQPQEVSSACLL